MSGGGRQPQLWLHQLRHVRLGDDDVIPTDHAGLLGERVRLPAASGRALAHQLLHHTRLLRLLLPHQPHARRRHHELRGGERLSREGGEGPYEQQEQATSVASSCC